MKVQKVKPELITHWALCHIQSDVWMLSEVAVVTLKCFKVPRKMCGGCMKTLYVLYKTHEHSQVVSITGSWNHFAKAWRVKGIQFTLFSWVAELGLGPNAWTQVPVCLVTGLGCISCVTRLLYRMGTTMGIRRREGAFLPERQSLENPKMPEGGGKKVEQKS